MSPDLEDQIYRFGGRFAFVIITDDIQRMYLDPGGTLGAVYSADHRRVASTVSALVWDDSTHPVWAAESGAFPDNKANQYWPAGLTMDPAIRRLLPVTSSISRTGKRYGTIHGLVLSVSGQTKFHTWFRKSQVA